MGFIKDQGWIHSKLSHMLWARTSRGSAERKKLLKMRLDISKTNQSNHHGKKSEFVLQYFLIQMLGRWGLFLIPYGKRCHHLFST